MIKYNLNVNNKTNKLLVLSKAHIDLDNNKALQTTIPSSKSSIENLERSEII